MSILELPGLADPSTPTRDEVQAEMVESLARCRADGIPAALLQAPTGLGKSRTVTKFAALGIEEWGMRLLFLAHRKELVRQAAREFRRAGIPFEVEWAESRATRGASLLDHAPVVIASKDSIQRDRLTSFPRDAFTDIVADEAHLSVAKTFRNVFEHFTGAKFRVGPTATPYRLDGQSLWEDAGALFHVEGHRAPLSFERLKSGEPGVPAAFAARYGLPLAIEHGHLASIVNVTCKASIDLKGIRTTRGTRDFNKGDLEDRIAKKCNSIADSVREDLERLDIRRALMFTPDVGSSRTLAELLTAKGVPAAAVWGGSKAHPMTDRQRDDTIRAYQEGETRVLLSCELLTTGFDDPPTQAIIMARPTRSLALAYQCVGRGTRLCVETGKRDVKVLGFEWEGAKGIVSTLDFFLEDEPSAKVRQKARQIAAGRKDADPRKVLAEAREEVERLEKGRLRIKADAPKATGFERVTWTPFKAATLLGVGLERAEAKAGPPAPPPTVQYLADYGLKGAAKLPAPAAEKLAEAMLTREFRGLCSLAEVEQLVRRGVPRAEAEGMRRRDAEAVLRRPKGVSPRMRAWLLRSGFAPAAVDRMTAPEAADHFLRITGKQRRA